MKNKTEEIKNRGKWKTKEIEKLTLDDEDNEEPTLMDRTNLWSRVILWIMADVSLLWPLKQPTQQMNLDYIQETEFENWKQKR